MTTELEQKLRDLEDQFSDLRGLDSVRAIHSLLVEAATVCDEKFGLTIIEGIERYGLSRDFDTSEKPFAHSYLYNSLLINVYQGEDPPDSGRILQEELPLGISEVLPMCGLNKEEICEVFSHAVENLERNKLWDVYENNIYVRGEA